MEKIKNIDRNKNKEECLGCIAEMMECYYWQSQGYDAGLDWGEAYEVDGLHCSVFVLDKDGEFIVE